MCEWLGWEEKAFFDRTVCVKAQRYESKRAKSLVELKRIGVKVAEIP